MQKAIHLDPVGQHFTGEGQNFFRLADLQPLKLQDSIVSLWKSLFDYYLEVKSTNIKV